MRFEIGFQLEGHVHLDCKYNHGIYFLIWKSSEI